MIPNRGCRATTTRPASDFCVMGTLSRGVRWLKGVTAMPTYDYQCNSCGHRFDRLQKMSDPPLTTCPECGGQVRRLIGAGAAVIFKGSGFHSTDYSQVRPSCGRDQPCCGRDTPCGAEPCDD